jgi:diaminohydroxyphosphoribosylaminopyrimidine deaminase/5-amino-6-(5-phosphoribosylamino)uracil reductase
VIVEGGANLLNSFIREKIWDEARVITGETEFAAGISAPELRGIVTDKTEILGDEIKIYHPPE